MEKRRLIKTVLCLVLAFAMTFAPIFSSYAVIASAAGEAEVQTTETDGTTAADEAVPSDDAAPADPQPAAEDAADPAEPEEGVQPESQPAADEVTDQQMQEEETAEPEEQEEVKAEKTEYVWKDSKVRVTARLSDPEAIPDDAKLVATAIDKDSEGYNYDAYMQALNDNSDSKITEKNTLLYDVAFIKDGVELQPASGSVSVTFEFLDKQLADSIGANKASDVNVIHLPLAENVKDKFDTTADATDIQASDIDVQTITSDENSLKVSVRNEKVIFNTDNFSVFAYTVDFEYNGYEFSMPGNGKIELSEVFKQLHIDEDINNVENVEFSNEDLVEVHENKNLFGKDWTLVSKKAFSSKETLKVELTNGTIVINVTDAQEYEYIIKEADGNAFVTESCALVPAFGNINADTLDPLSISVKDYADQGLLVDNYNYDPDDHYSIVGSSMQKYLAGGIDRAGLAKEVENYWKSVTPVEH